MTDSSSTGRFWLCPQCRRHVPIRTDVCQCGLDRSRLPVKVQEVGGQGAAPENAPRSHGLVVVLAVVLACGGLLYWGLRGLMTQEAGGPEVPRKLHLRGQAPQVVFVPVPVAPPGSPPEPEGQQPSPTGLDEQPADSEISVEAEPPAPAVMVKPKTEEELQVELADSIYRPRMERIAAEVMNVWNLKQRYRAVCATDTVTTTTSVRDGSGTSVGSVETSGRTTITTRGGRVVGYGDSRGSGTAITRSSWREVTSGESRTDNTTTPECRALALDIRASAVPIARIMAEAEAQAIQQGVWTRIQSSVPEQLAQELWGVR